MENTTTRMVSSHLAWYGGDRLADVPAISGSLNPDHTLKGLGLPPTQENMQDFESTVSPFKKAVSNFNSEDLDQLMNDELRQAGTISRSTDEYLASEHGQANAHVGLYEIDHHPSSSQDPSWWPENAFKPSSARRPLAGLRVVDLTRIIAGPAITRSLAEMGASVMRVTSSTQPDLSAVHHDLNWGKWNCDLDLHQPASRAKLVDLIREADVVVDGYRPGVMDRLGFGRSDVFDMVRGRDRGIIHVRENCYGWHGPWAGRSGWQQISDAVCLASRLHDRRYILQRWNVLTESVLITVLWRLTRVRKSHRSRGASHSNLPQLGLLVCPAHLHSFRFSLYRYSTLT